MLIVVSVVSFGARSFRKTIYFLLLEFSLTAFGTGAHGKIGEAVLGIAGFVCLFALSKRERTIPIELCWVDQRVKFTAMLDTGNRLKDPVTGQPVLVVGCDVAKELVALTKEQLQDPVQTITEGVFPGLRLIPYSTISQPNAMMLALRIPCAKVGNKKGSVVVAFAPEMIAGNGKYRGLMGGTV